MAVPWAVILAAGILSVNNSPSEPSMAIRVDSASVLSPASTGSTAGRTPPLVAVDAVASSAGAISLGGLVREIRAAPTTQLENVALAATDAGVASWFDAPARTCAHRTLPMGTVAKVTRTDTGASTSCRVSDRGPTVQTGRVIDLSLDTFEDLAGRDAGLVDVTIEW